MVTESPCTHPTHHTRCVGLDGLPCVHRDEERRGDVLIRDRPVCAGCVIAKSIRLVGRVDPRTCAEIVLGER